MNRFNILIVDDYEENIFTLKLLLNDGFDNLNIIEARDVKEALVLIMKNDIDLILSDIQMPEIDGFEFVEYLQGVEATKDIPVILITGIYHDTKYKKKAFGHSSKVVDFISKPIDDELLCSKLKVYIELFEERKKNKQEIREKDKLLKEQIKINSMIDFLESLDNSLKISLEESESFKELINDEDLIDLEFVTQKESRD